MDVTSRLSDTTGVVSARQRALIGALSPVERLSRALALSALAREFTWAGARRFAGEHGADAVRERFLEQAYGPGTAEWVAARMAKDGLDAHDELTQSLASMTAALEVHRVPYFVTGSLAASTHGEFRATNAIDIVADFASVDLRALMRAFEADFYADVDQAVSCVRDGQSFNLIHKTSFLKVDLFPAVSGFNQMAIERAQLMVIGEGGPEILVATREDILLAKLWWYRLGDESSETQWRDITGIVALNREALDRAYLERWAAELGVRDLLDRFLVPRG